MNGIEISYENGQVAVNSQFDRRNEPVVLTSDEKVAVDLVFFCLAEIGVSSDLLHLERRTDNYLTIVLNELDDFCRVKMGARSKWFSLSMVLIKKQYAADARLASVKNRNQFHWKIPLDKPEDISHYCDIIQASCKQFLK